MTRDEIIALGRVMRTKLGQVQNQQEGIDLPIRLQIPPAIVRNDIPLAAITEAILNAPVPVIDATPIQEAIGELHRAITANCEMTSQAHIEAMTKVGDSMEHLAEMIGQLVQVYSEGFADLSRQLIAKPRPLNKISLPEINPIIQPAVIEYPERPKRKIRITHPDGTESVIQEE